MKVISADVGWKPNTRRNAVVVATPPGRIDFLDKGLGDVELDKVVREWIEPQSLVLLDVPIEGCDNLPGHWRPVEKSLQHYIPLYPPSKAKGRGSELKQELLQVVPENVRSSVNVQEIYPYAVYKFLWVARQKGKLESVKLGRWERILDDGFRQTSPPKYKGRVQRDQRLSEIQGLRNLLTGCPGSGFAQQLDFPDRSLRASELELLSDEYDACLGAVVGLLYVNSNPYARVIGDKVQGEILLLTDAWLKSKLESSGLSVEGKTK